MISEKQPQQQSQYRRRRRRRRISSTTTTVAAASASSSPIMLSSSSSSGGGGGVCAATLLALVLVILPMERALASPPPICRKGDGLSLIIRGVGSFLSSSRRSSLLQQEPSRGLFSSSSSSDSSSSSLPFSFGTRRITTAEVHNNKPSTATFDDLLEEEAGWRELDALYGGDDDHQEDSSNANNAAAKSSTCFRSKSSSSQDVARRLQKVNFSYSHKRRKQQDARTTTLFPEADELQLLESSSLSCSSRPRRVCGDVHQQIIPSSASRKVAVVSTAATPASAHSCDEVRVTVHNAAAAGAGASARTSSKESSLRSSSSSISTETVVVRGGKQKTATTTTTTRPLLFWESMVCGAISRSTAQTLLHPANAMKTILQNSRAETVASLMKPSSFHRLTKGAGANFLLSVPHGAVNFAVLEFVRSRLGALAASNPALQERSGRLGPTLDFVSSALSTIVCSVVSTPQMMITDNIMAGNFNNLPQAITGLAKRGGFVAFYRGWWPGLVGKIPSYALTWTLFQELKVMRDRLTHHRPATNIENAIMGCLASATTVTIMIPLDTIKTRLVTQGGSAVGSRVYKGIIDCAVRVAREEGINTFYRGLPPRLASVVPMIGIQFGVYEAMKNVMLQRTGDGKSPEKKVIGGDSKEKKDTAAPVETPTSTANGEYDASQVFEEAAMEVAASPEQPYPAPQFLKKRVYQKTMEQAEKTLQEQSRKPWKKVLKLQR